MGIPGTARVVFVCTAALLAAAFGDALVEGISDANVFWHGRYTDQSSLDLFPVLIAALAIVVLLGRSVQQQIRKTGLPARTLIRSASRALIPSGIVYVLPTIFVMQIVVLFGMETTEQVVVYGHAFGGTLWLGGPVLPSLLIHAVLAIACAFVLSGALTALADALVRVVKSIFARYVETVRVRTAASKRPVRTYCATQLVVAATIVERGPPASVALRSAA